MRAAISSWMIDGMPDVIWFRSTTRVCGSSVGAPAAVIVSPYRRVRGHRDSKFYRWMQVSSA